MRLLAAFERQIEFSYTESAIKKQFAVSQTVRRGARPGESRGGEERPLGGGRQLAHPRFGKPKPGIEGK